MPQRHDRPRPASEPAKPPSRRHQRTPDGARPVEAGTTQVADDAAAWLREVTRGGDPVDLLTPHPSLRLDVGYEIQERMLDGRCRDGEVVVGAAVSAIGPTKPCAIADDEPTYRWLTDAMHVDASAGLCRSTVFTPRVRPEVAFIVDRDLDDPQTSAADVLDACDAVLPALVIVDYRLRQPVVRPGDVVAICAATSRFVLGDEPVPLDEVDLSASRCIIESDKAPSTTASGYELPGTAADAAAWLARQAVARGRAIESGMIILSGGLCGSHAVDAGETVAAHFDHIGDVELSCT
jgi:2-keto-4-pentenoate hydratase